MQRAVVAWGGALFFFAGLLASGCSNDPGVTCERACSGAQSCCDVGGGTGGCVDTLTNPQHCGGCGIDCGSGMTCSLGRCVAGGADTGPRPDGGHDAGPTGMCRPQCASGLMCCGTTCVSATGVPSGDGRTDPSFQNCRTCGVMCNAMNASRCGPPRGMPSAPPQCLCGDSAACDPGFECQLNGGTYSCINMLTDPRHCGTPPVSCGAGEGCMDGMCTCVAAGHLCAAGETCTSTGCIDTTSDPANCGTVGHACGVGENCTDSACHCGTGPVCPGPRPLMGECGQICCADTCVPVDGYNCGTCGNTCPVGGGCGSVNPFSPMRMCNASYDALFLTCGDPVVATDAGTDVDAAVDVDADVDAALDVDADVDAGS